MSKNLLVEIGTEEMPARFVSGAVEQLADKLKKWLNESLISYEKVELYSTPRRITVTIMNVAEKQEDRIEEVRGPAIKIAKDELGNWTKAAQGFVKGQGLLIEDIYVSSVKDIEYVFVKKEYKGEEVEGLLSATLTEIIKGMSFPKNMHWGSEEIRYVRPIRWILALYGQKLIPVEIAQVKSSRLTKGHRFLGKDIPVSFIEEYENLLREQFVIVDPEKRKQMILQQITKIEKDNNWVIPIENKLLSEVVNLVEYPTALYGSFKAEYLDLPKEVLVTTMKEHQKYFSVEDKEGKILPYFITVRNGDTRSLDTVRRGNEKVLTARLADARFFYLEDQKKGINESISKLEHIVFQEGIGTIGDKVRRIRDIALALSEELKLDTKASNDTKRTAEICKFDLVTNMVYEFPELQGLMGGKYAKFHGENEMIAGGISEHYLPRYSGDKLPETVSGQITSIADKIDNIIGSFSLGKIPTGSQDPLGLRRQAAGIVQILLEKLQNIELNMLFNMGLDAYEQKGLLKRSRTEILSDLDDFFTLRIKNSLQEKEIRYDVIDAVLESDKNNVKIIADKALTLNKEVNKPDFKGIVDSFTRVMNIASKGISSETNPKYYLEEVEKNLYNQFIITKKSISESENRKQSLDYLKSLKEPIDAYFDQVMIMVEDEELRQHRLGLMLSISQLIREYADFNKLVFV